MKIVRNGIEIELSDEELEAAYREREQQYRRMDCTVHLAEYFGIDVEADDVNATGDYERFFRVFGCTFIDAVSLDSKYCVLDLLVERFNDRFDANIDENGQWENAIDEVVRESEAAGASVKLLTDLAEQDNSHN